MKKLFKLKWDRKKVSNFLFEVAAFIFVIPIAIISLIWFLLQIAWVYIGLTLVFSFLFSLLDPTLTPEQCVGYGGSMSILWGIISKVRKGLKE